MSDIDPAEFGELRANVRALMESDRAKTEALTKLADAMKDIQITLATAKGGWKFFLMTGSAVASCGGAIGWLIHEFFKR